MIEVDDEDRLLISNGKVNLCHGYVRVGRMMLHDLIMRPPAGYEVDHRDGNPLNCRRSNLRIATRSQNNSNRRVSKSNKTGFKGVDRKGNKFRAVIQVNKVQKHLGYFD